MYLIDVIKVDGSNSFMTENQLSTAEMFGKLLSKDEDVERVEITHDNNPLYFGLFINGSVR